MDFSKMNFDELAQSKSPKKPVSGGEQKSKIEFPSVVEEKKENKALLMEDFSIEEGEERATEEGSSKKALAGKIILVLLLVLSCWSIFACYPLLSILFIATSVALFLSIKGKIFELISMLGLSVLAIVYIFNADINIGNFYQSIDPRYFYLYDYSPANSNSFWLRMITDFMHGVDAVIAVANVFMWIAIVGFAVATVLFAVGLKWNEKLCKYARIVFLSAITVLACIFIFVFPTNGILVYEGERWALGYNFFMITVDTPRAWVALLAGFIIRQFIHRSEGLNEE